MADGYDRFDNEGSGGGSFVMGLLTGTVLGAGLGMLFAPKAGSELRSQLSEQAGNLANRRRKAIAGAENAGQWAENGKETASEWAERGRDVYDKAKDAVDEAPTKRSATCATPTQHGTSPARPSPVGAGTCRCELRFGLGLDGTGSAAQSAGPQPDRRPGSTGGPRRS